MTTAVRQKPAVSTPLTSKKSKLKSVVAIAMIPITLLALYVFSVIWRVSAYEQKVFGRSELIPMSLQPRKFTEIPSMETYGAFTYDIQVNHKPLRVHKQVINGFQHAFGSGLVAYELGEQIADLLFRANEYVEAYFSGDGRRYSHYMDTRKDLYNNMIGRAIGMEARQKNLTGGAADRYISARVLNSIQNREVIPHWLEPKVKDLPSLEEYGCPGLPHPSPDE
ncbi:hypothetical protein KF707_00800 [Candidatus Obscuribacterales bacterium]|nr:hypothetical protein [Candidatus Obscuribacterales bacterium]MBX3150209.1 hypothetical protein [Candidatus Obscuribacterales bacterium]